MKKLLLSIVLLMTAASAQAAYIDYGYSGTYDLKDDVSILAQASLLLKGSDRSAASEKLDEKLKKTISRQCQGIAIKWEKTKAPNSEMRRIKTKADQLCDQWTFD